MEAERQIYKDHSISTLQLSDGSWIASFWRVDGAPMLINGVQHDHLFTESYLGKFIAVADAELEIDSITAVWLRLTASQ